MTFDNGVTTVKGPKGQVTKELPTYCEIKQKDGVINISRSSNSRIHRQMHGLTRALLNNMVVGVSDGFTKELEIVGVGYKAELKGKDLVLILGYSHPINFPVPEGLTIEVWDLVRGI